MLLNTDTIPTRFVPQWGLATAAMALLAANAHAQTGAFAPVMGSAVAVTQWQQCAAIGHDAMARLACFDALVAAQQGTATQSTNKREEPGMPPALASSSQTYAHTATDVAAAPPDATLNAAMPGLHIPNSEGCRNKAYTDHSRFWELEKGSDCGTFQFRGYRPITLALAGSDSVNRQPSSDAPDHTAATATPYRRTENRLQLSVRTKVAQGLLTQGEPDKRDSLWFGYTQQSYWQLYSPEISRPFRTTDHEPELIYIYPTDVALPWGWRWRYAGAGLNHQSNGQSLPLSRSWNRSYLMAGFELGHRWRVQAKLWKRITESADSDDNPGISDTIGRGELQTFWNMDADNTLGMTVRHSLTGTARGSVRLEWLQTVGKGWSKSLGSGQSDLRLHTQLFSGYGDSLVDYNRRRTVFSIGLSLVDF